MRKVLLCVRYDDLHQRIFAICSKLDLVSGNLWTELKSELAGKPRLTEQVIVATRNIASRDSVPVNNTVKCLPVERSLSTRWLLILLTLPLLSCACICGERVHGTIFCTEPVCMRVLDYTELITKTIQTTTLRHWTGCLYFSRNLLVR